MRIPAHILVDRALMLYLLQLAEPHGYMSDVKFQQLVFLSELQMLGKGLRGFHYEFTRFAYGAFSKDLDDDLTFLRRKGRLENFSLGDEALPIVDEMEALITDADVAETNEQIVEIIRTVIETYGPQDNGQVMESVEAIELSSTDDAPSKIAIRDISFHTVMLVPLRVEVSGEFTISAARTPHIKALIGS